MKDCPAINSELITFGYPVEIIALKRPAEGPS